MPMKTEKLSLKKLNALETTVIRSKEEVLKELIYRIAKLEEKSN